jgi:hypothetical protein
MAADRHAHGRLLMMASKKDRTVDPVLVHSALEQYRKSSAITELIDYEVRGHKVGHPSAAESHQLIRVHALPLGLKQA